MAMKTMNPELPDSEKILYLAGQVHALYAVLKALVVTHPDIGKLAYQYALFTETQEADSLNLPTPEPYRRGEHETRLRMAEILQSLGVE